MVVGENHERADLRALKTVVFVSVDAFLRSLGRLGCKCNDAQTMWVGGFSVPALSRIVDVWQSRWPFCLPRSHTVARWWKRVRVSRGVSE